MAEKSPGFREVALSLSQFYSPSVFMADHQTGSGNSYLVWRLSKVTALWFVCSYVSSILANTAGLRVPLMAYFVFGAFFLHALTVTFNTTPADQSSREFYIRGAWCFGIGLVLFFALRLVEADDLEKMTLRVTEAFGTAARTIDESERAFRRMRPVEHLA